MSCEDRCEGRGRGRRGHFWELLLQGQARRSNYEGQSPPQPCDWGVGAPVPGYGVHRLYPVASAVGGGPGPYLSSLVVVSGTVGV